MVSRARPVAVLTAVVFLCGSASTVDAQQARARRLRYDTTNKAWVEDPPAAAGTAEGDLQNIKLLVRNGKHRKALSSIKALQRTKGKAHPLRAELLLARSEALIGSGDYCKAHLAVQEFLSEFRGHPLTSRALRLDFVIAETFLTGVKRKILGFRLLSGEDLAYRILDDIFTDDSESELAELAIKTKADHLFLHGDYALAELEYVRLLRDFPQTRFHQLASSRSANAAVASFAGVPYDEAPLIEATERYQEYLHLYPAAAKQEGVPLVLERLREMRAEKDFLIGRYYERTDHTGSAVFQFELVRKEWPGTIAATKAAKRLELLGTAEPISRLSDPVRRLADTRTIP